MGLFDDIIFWLDLLKWLVLLWVAFFSYNWAKEHLPFSPLLSTVVGLLLVYFLVIEHPFFGAIGAIGWAIISSSLLLLVPSLLRLFSLKR